MLKYVFAAGLGAALLAQAVPGDCGQRRAVAMVVSASGDASLRRPGENKVPLKQREPLYLGDIVETGAGGSASLVLLYGSEVRVSENTEVEFIPGSKRDLISLLRGQIWTRMLHKKGKLDVRTITAICAVRGTEADIESKEKLTVKVYEGHVDVSNKAGKVSLKAGEMTTVAGASSSPDAPVKMKPADIGTWQRGISSEGILELLEELKADPDKRLDLNIRKRGESDRDVRIKLKKKDGGGSPDPGVK